MEIFKWPLCKKVLLFTTFKVNTVNITTALGGKDHVFISKT